MKKYKSEDLSIGYEIYLGDNECGALKNELNELVINLFLISASDNDYLANNYDPYIIYEYYEDMGVLFQIDSKLAENIVFKNKNEDIQSFLRRLFEEKKEEISNAVMEHSIRIALELVSGFSNNFNIKYTHSELNIMIQNFLNEKLIKKIL